MSQSLPISTLKKLFFRAGLKRWVLTWLCTTLTLFGVELSLSYSMQQLIALLMGQQERIIIPWVTTHEALPTLFVIALFSLVCLRAICTLGSVYSQEGMREKTSVFLRNQWVRTALFSPMDLVEQSRLTNLLVEAIPRAGNFFAAFMHMIFQAFLAILYMSACLIYGANLFLVAIFLFVLVAMIVRFVGVRSSQCGNQRAEWMVRLNEYLLRAKKNHKLIKLLHMEKFEVQTIENQSHNYFHFSLKANQYYALACNAPNSLGYVTVTLILLLAIHLDYKTNIIIFIYLLFRFSQAMGASAGGFSQIRSLEASFLQACNIPDIPTSDHKENIPPSKQPIEEIKIDLEKLPHPEPNNPPLLENIELMLKGGESLGIIGPSGCGKSTFLDSILKLYKPFQGQVLINGKSWKLPEFNQRISYVSSDPYLIGGSIFENLVYGNHRKELHEPDWLLNSLKAAQLMDLIPTEKELHSLQITESGLGLSTGQKQRLSIARALARKPDLLILDEATSNLDSTTENLVWDAIYNLFPKTIIILVTHRVAFANKATYLLDFSHNPPTLEVPGGES